MRWIAVQPVMLFAGLSEGPARLVGFVLIGFTLGCADVEPAELDGVGRAVIRAVAISDSLALDTLVVPSVRTSEAFKRIEREAPRLLAGFDSDLLLTAVEMEVASKGATTVRLVYRTKVNEDSYAIDLWLERHAQWRVETFSLRKLNDSTPGDA